MSEQITLARAIAYMAHRKQYRNDGLTAYFLHPKAVAESLSKWNEYVIATAYLHDVLEDTDLALGDLQNMGVHGEILSAVWALTHQKNDPYMKYIENISRNEIAKIVKVADIQHNLSDKPSKHQIEKYKKALAFLARV